MSRLEQHNKKQLSQKILVTVVLVIAAIVFFFSLGIKLLVSLTLFINQLANGNTKQSQTQQSETLSSISIDPIPSATNSATILFSGSALSYDKLEIYLNDEKRDEIDISDTFAGEVQGLEKGDNTIHFIAKSSRTKKTEKTQNYEVIYKNEKPKLEVSEPGENARTNKEDIRITGKTDREVEIRINGQPIVVDAEGKFTTLFRLKDGENKIEVVAEDIVGNQEKKSLTVTYAKDD
jgi:hypothetical protein